MTMMMTIATMTKTMTATATTTMKRKGDYSHDNKYIYVIHHCLWMALIKNGSHNNQPKIGVHNEGEYGGEMRRAGGAWDM
jgi:hypothetical protein